MITPRHRGIYFKVRTIVGEMSIAATVSTGSRPGRSRGAAMAADLTPVPVNPATLPKPSGYSHGTLSGNTLYLGGQTALDKDMRIVPGGIVEQFRQAFANVLSTLGEAGGRPADLVSITLYLTDIPDYQAHGKQ